MDELKPWHSLTIPLDAYRAKRASRTSIRKRQRRRLDALLTFVRRQSRFYKRHYADVPERARDLDRFPPVTKSTLMDEFDDVVTDPAVTKAEVDAFVADESAIGRRFLGRYPVWTTSGTTGEPGTFLQDDYAMTVLDTLPERWMTKTLLDPSVLRRLVRNDFRSAAVTVTGGHYAGVSGVELFRRESAFLGERLRVFSPSQPLSDLVAALNEFQPAILFGYATVLVALAEAQRRGRLAITPAYVVPSAESVTTAEKRLMRRAFGCPVREEYGATEFYAIAFECEAGRLHANTDWVVLEPVDEDYNPVSLDEPSHTVLLTNLANRVQPLVRYDLGDSIVVHADRCPCGSAFPVVEVEGRTDDVLHFESDAGEDVSVFPLSVSSVVEEVPGVHRAQVVQTGRSTLHVRLEPSADADETAVWDRVESDLTGFLADHGVTGVDVERGSEPPQRDPDSGKYRHVSSDLG